MNAVYHSSQRTGLQVIRPAASTHGEEWVYACRDPVMAAAFLSTTGGDLTCAVGREPDTGLVYICERFPGAFELRYTDRPGSIYVLPGSSFREGMTSWEEELVSPVAVRPLKEIGIACAARHLHGLEHVGALLIRYYPERIDGIPEDDEDLVMRGITWTRTHGDSVLDAFREYHPHLVDRVIRGTAEGRYASGHSRG